MKSLEKKSFEHQHKEFFVGNLDRGCFDKQMHEDSIDQNLGKLLVVGMIVVAFALVASKVSVNQDYNPN